MVVDASAVLEILLNRPSARAVQDSLVGFRQLMAPHLIDVEVMQVLRRYARMNAINASRAEEALSDYTDIPILRYPHNVLLRRIWELRHNLTAYDAAYVALAEALEAPLLTCDRALRSISGHKAKILVF